MMARRFPIQPKSAARSGYGSSWAQQTQTFRTPTVLVFEQPRGRDRTIARMILSSPLPGNGRRKPSRESFGELRACCMTAMISGPRCGSIVLTSLVISANSRVRATRPGLAYQDITRGPSHYSRTGEGNFDTSERGPHKNRDHVLSLREYFRKPSVLPSGRDNSTLKAVNEQWHVPPACLAVCPEPQIPSKRSGHDSVGSGLLKPGASKFLPPNTMFTKLRLAPSQRFSVGSVRA